LSRRSDSSAGLGFAASFRIDAVMPLNYRLLSSDGADHGEAGANAS
jgi:hypothetical protein